MRKSRFPGEQLGTIVKEGEAGVPVAALVRRPGISRQTSVNRRAKYAGISVAERRRMKKLEGENAKRKRMYAELALENAARTAVLPRKGGRRPRGARGATSWSRSTSSRFDPRAGRSDGRGRHRLGGRAFRIRTVLDEAHRDALAIESGTACTADSCRAWCAGRDRTLCSSQPGTPEHNAFIERCNPPNREDVLDASSVVAGSEAPAVTDAWRPTSTAHRPHQSLGHLPPPRCLPRPPPPAASSDAWSP